MTHAEPTLWTDSSLGPGPLGIVVIDTVPGQSGDRAQLMFGAASDGETHCGVLREQWGLFLRKHASATLVCFDAAKTHWLLHEFFAMRHDEQAIAALWAFSRECRLIDVGLLDQELRRVEGDGFPPVRHPPVWLAEIHARERIPNQDEIRQRVGMDLPAKMAELKLDRLEPLIQIASVLLPIEKSLRADAEKLVTRQIDDDTKPVEEPPPGVSRGVIEDGFSEAFNCGLLGSGIDVKGSIALAAAGNRGLRINADVLDSVKTGAERTFRHASASLRQIERIEKHLEWKGKCVRRSGPGEPAEGRKALEAMLTQKKGVFLDRMFLPVRRPSLGANSAEATINALGIWSRLDGDLAVLADLVKAGGTLRWLESKVHVTAHPVYDAVGPVHSRSPDLVFLSDLGYSLFTPRDGHSFLVVELEDLGARCLAALCRSWYFRLAIRLYTIFAGRRPMDKLAGALREAAGNHAFGRRKWTPFKPRSTGPEFNRSDTFDLSDDRDWWLLITNHLLETMALGLPKSRQLELVREVPSLAGLDDQSWDDLQQAFIEHVGSELRFYLGEDLLDPLSINLGVEKDIVRKVLNIEGWRNPVKRPHDRRNLAIRKEFDGEARESLLALAAASDAGSRPFAGSQQRQIQKLDWFKMRANSPGGRLTSRWFPADVRKQARESLINDVLKSVAFAVVANGYHLVAVAGHKLIVEVADSEARLEVEETVAQVCKRSATELLGAAAPPCRFSWPSLWPPAPVRENHMS